MIIFVFISPLLLEGYVLFLFIYFLKTNEIQKNFISSRRNIFVILFWVFSWITSLVHKNSYGVAISTGFLIFFPVIFVYKNNLTQNLFYLIIKVTTLMSILAFCLGLFQFHFINLQLNPDNIFLISDKPQFRVQAMFNNANFYATILELVILMSFYKMFLVKDKESSFSYYFTIIIMNCFMLYLTGCRTAWIALFISIPIVFIFQRKYYIGLSLVVVSFIGFNILLSFEILPRLDTLLHDLAVRINIWKNAFNGFSHHPIFGIGPYGYKLIDPHTPHAHSIYVGSLLSFGLIGTSALIGFLISYLRTLFLNFNTDNYPLIIGVVLLIAFHGLSDVTILQPQVSVLFFTIIFSIHVKDEIESTL